MENRFSSFASEALKSAREIAVKTKSGYIGSGHLLCALAENDLSVAGAFLKKKGVTAQKLKKSLSDGPHLPIENKESPTRDQAEGGTRPRASAELKLSSRLETIIRRSTVISSQEDAQEEISSEHLLAAILEQDCAASALLADQGLDSSELCEELRVYSLTLRNLLGKQIGAGSGEDASVLKSYTRDLTKEAAEGKLGLCVGREKECMRILQILCRKSKNNPCLLGEPGVGKTAIVERVAGMIASNDLPLLRGCRILSLSLTSLVAGSRYRGDFEQRMKEVIDEAKDRSVILFIDEIHMLIGAGSSEGSFDAANILKPALSRGEIRVIGATTFREYERLIEKDAALERRFAKVIVNEPDAVRTIGILKGVRREYERFHDVRISDSAIEAAVSFSENYMVNRRFPDKAIDLIDEAASMQKLRRSTKALGKREIEKALSSLLGKEVFSFSDKKSRARKEKALNAVFPGNGEAVKDVLDCLFGAREENRPIAGVFYLDGEPGLCEHFVRAFDKCVFENEGGALCFDMHAFTDKSSLSRLIGAPPGYVGFGEDGLLTGRAIRQPFSAIFFGSFDFASPEIKAVVYEMCREGRLKDASGRTVDFRNCVVFISHSAKSKTKTTAGFFANGPAERKKEAPVLCDEEEKKLIDRMIRLKGRK